MDRSSVPWSIKGVSKKSRRLAKDAAARDGVTMGEWLAAAIRHVEGLEAPVAASAPSAPVAATEDYPAPRQSPAPPPPATLSAALPPAPPAGPELDALARQIAESEQRILEMLAPLHDAVQRLAARVEAIEAHTPTYYRRLPGQWARPVVEEERT